MRKEKLSNGKIVEIKKLKFLDMADIGDAKGSKEIVKKMIHVATKMPYEEIEDLDIIDGVNLTNVIKEENPGIGEANFTASQKEKDG